MDHASHQEIPLITAEHEASSAGVERPEETPRLKQERLSLLKRSPIIRKIHEQVKSSPPLAKAFALALAVHAGAGAGYGFRQEIREKATDMVTVVDREARREIRDTRADARRETLRQQANTQIEQERFDAGSFILEAEAIDEAVDGRTVDVRLARARYEELRTRVRQELGNQPHTIDNVRQAITRATNALGYRYAGLGGTLMSELLRMRRGSCQQIALLIGALAYDNGLHNVELRRYWPTPTTIGHMAPVIERETPSGRIVFDLINNKTAVASTMDMPMERLPDAYLSPHFRYPLIFTRLSVNQQQTPQDINSFGFPIGISNPYLGTAPLQGGGILPERPVDLNTPEPTVSWTGAVTAPFSRQRAANPNEVTAALSWGTEADLDALYPLPPEQTVDLSSGNYIVFDSTPLPAAEEQQAQPSANTDDQPETELEREELERLGYTSHSIERLERALTQNNLPMDRFALETTLRIKYQTAFRIVERHHMRYETHILQERQQALEESLHRQLATDAPRLAQEIRTRIQQNPTDAYAGERANALFGSIDDERIRPHMQAIIRTVIDRIPTSRQEYENYDRTVYSAGLVAKALIHPTTREETMRLLNDVSPVRRYLFITRELSDSAAPDRYPAFEAALNISESIRENRAGFRSPQELQAIFAQNTDIQRLIAGSSPEEQRQLFNELAHAIDVQIPPPADMGNGSGI